MRRIYLLLTIFFFLTTRGGYADVISTPDSISVKKKTPRFLALNGMGGLVIPSNDYIRDGNATPSYGSLSFKYGIYSKGDSWKDFAYGMPYYGVGIYTARFFNKKALGNPISLYLFQGGDLKIFNPRLSLKYELNLGMSFNWTPYDVFDNPDNIALGSATNIHVGANVYLKNRLNDKWDLNFGLGLTHFSNGAQRLPNKGVNLFAPFVELVYNLDYEPVNPSKRNTFTPPTFDKHIDYDIMVTISSRQAWVDTTGTGLPSRLLDKNFKVFGLSYATMFANNYKYKWGPSMELVYDESAGIKVWRQIHPEDGQYYDRVKLGSAYKRFSLGISMKGELTFDRISFFANLGCNLLYGSRFYQIIGVKAYLKDNIFGTFGIRANNFTKAQFLYWSIGYTIKGRPLHKKDKYVKHILP
ncbi:hypothetical protein M2463_002240 [Parabacteroides sp. PH5-13]|uniref:acyloxyacyl hydrolase n=1 Tax=unclassified Parabacteroides TaxID=2649774 RepID=UPI002475AE36|nr:MULTISPECIES: acyloxyacyl hydrolase [unclassified Parabacteroides]MDH6305243.1 hypothetical protein [Parabacteroides sp. PH5-39]MDH6320224.1 hypothetical protein [Parabacteroides sp. PH5-13]MDH6323833.1 hypothetical protein [Parabacteroides sp. PH5-8]MDH6384945.1 hypothetical protein [Parabacteroides sp. PH5-17]MDH6394421.1 hypothetical protein [Parabacteroides sp. PFB2-22]